LSGGCEDDLKDITKPSFVTLLRADYDVDKLKDNRRIYRLICN